MDSGPATLEALDLPHVSHDALSGWLLTANLSQAGPITAVEEEILFRGVLFAWLRSLTSMVPAALVSAVVFAAVHHGLGAVNVVLAFVAGVVLAWLYERSHSLVPGIIVHAAWNLSSMLFLAAVAGT